MVSAVICDNLAFTILIYAAIKLCLLVISYIYINQLEVFQRIVDSVAEGRRELEAEKRKLEAEERKLEDEKRKLEDDQRKLEDEQRKSEAEASEKRN
ncbi:hypothetical protein AVEN_32622-1 [Araneus ventricosus]|uniref:Uncharacterized protein n=1 Tax=Araneus ventricosus TaxID=182803 RepID=A0A4Y2C7C6_ARAVE|nr:hypothetical protein AVEN_32622-1 [Araneus ventricosus]